MLFVFDAIVNIESTLVLSVLPTIGIKDPTAFFTDRLSTESEDADRKFCKDMTNEKSVTKPVITHLINFFIWASIDAKEKFEDILLIREEDKNKHVSGIRMLLEMRCKIVDINETAVEKTAPEKELPDEMQSETITGIADAQKTFNDSTDSFTRFKVCCIDGKHIAIIEMNTADEYVFCR